MKVVQNVFWVFYIGNNAKELREDKCGKWMYFFDNLFFVSDICKKAVQSGVVREAKHSNAEKGVSCFYLNCDEIENHKKVLKFFIENGLIKKTKAGKYYNISFKKDDQTRNGEYGTDFHSELTLSDFVDLETGRWKDE